MVAHPVLSEIILCLVLCIIRYSYSCTYCGGTHWLTANRYLYMYWLFYAVLAVAHWLYYYNVLAVILLYKGIDEGVAPCSVTNHSFLNWGKP